MMDMLYFCQYVFMMLGRSRGWSHRRTVAADVCLPRPSHQSPYCVTESEIVKRCWALKQTIIRKFCLLFGCYDVCGVEQQITAVILIYNRLLQHLNVFNLSCVYSKILKTWTFELCWTKLNLPKKKKKPVSLRFLSIFTFVFLCESQQVSENQGLFATLSRCGLHIARGPHLHQTIVSRELRHVVITSQSSALATTMFPFGHTNFNTSGGDYWQS